MGSHTYRWRRVLGGACRHGQPCRVLARGRMNSICVEFEDGWRPMTSPRRRPHDPLPVLQGDGGRPHQGGRNRCAQSRPSVFMTCAPEPK